MTTERATILDTIRSEAARLGLALVVNVAATGSTYAKVFETAADAASGTVFPIVELRIADHHGAWFRREAIDVDSVAFAREIMGMAAGGFAAFRAAWNAKADAKIAAEKAADRAREIARQARSAHRRMMEPSRSAATVTE